MNGRAVGRYVLYDEIASGGMATVHFGRLVGPAGFARTVALKRLHPTYAKDPEFVAMFQDEARLAARIRHPNVVPTLDIVLEDGELFLAMEYVHGASLAQIGRVLRAREDAVPPAVAVAVMVGALSGLHAAHEATGDDGAPLDVVHRDVSPQNVLVGVDGVARVVDFGIAKAVGRLQTTREGQVKGKAAYLAPEQVRGRDVDRRADVYGASVVLWEALTGQRLFVADEPIAVMTAVLEKVVLAPSAVRSGLPEALDAVVLRGLARARDDRFATARDMAIALEAVERPASAREVGEWLESVAADGLRERARKVAEIESAVSRPSEAPAALPASSREAPRRSRAPALAAGAAIVLAVGAFAATRAATRAAAPAPAASSAAPIAESVDPAADDPGVALSADPAPAPSAAPFTPRRAAPRPRHTVQCKPPYTVDANGVRHWKSGC